MMIIILCCSNFNFLHPFYQQRKTAAHMRTCVVVAKGLKSHSSEVLRKATSNSSRFPTHRVVLTCDDDAGWSDSAGCKFSVQKVVI